MAGRSIALLEARRASELASLVETYGGVPLLAPALREDPIDDLDAIGRFLDLVESRSLDVMVFQTGVGARALERGVETLGRTSAWRLALQNATVVVRGPKPTAVLREFGIRIDVRVAEPFTTAELLEALASVDVHSRLVAIQQFGETNRELSDALLRRGAEIVELEVYRWALPSDTGPLERLLDDLMRARVDGLIVTSQVQVRHLAEVANRKGLGAVLPDLLRDRVVVAAVGPVAARALVDHGIRVDLEPSHPKMGPLVRDLATHFSAVAPRRPICPS